MALSFFFIFKQIAVLIASSAYKMLNSAWLLATLKPIGDLAVLDALHEVVARFWVAPAARPVHEPVLPGLDVVPLHVALLGPHVLFGDPGEHQGVAGLRKSEDGANQRHVSSPTIFKTMLERTEKKVLEGKCWGRGGQLCSSCWPSALSRCRQRPCGPSTWRVPWGCGTWVSCGADKLAD